jgi:hypothetical protein
MLSLTANEWKPKMPEASKLVILTALNAEAKVLAGITGATVHVIGLRGARGVPPVAPGSRVIVAGLGGALDPTLRVGDLVIDTVVADGPWRLGAIHSAEHAVTTPEAKAALFRETGALAVDMEQAAVRRVLPADVQVIGLRAISDPADMAIDPAVLRFIDDVGRPRPLAIAAQLLRRPRLIPHLRELQANSAVALRNLALGVHALVGRFTSEPHLAYAPSVQPGTENLPGTPL